MTGMKWGMGGRVLLLLRRYEIYHDEVNMRHICVKEATISVLERK